MKIISSIYGEWQFYQLGCDIYGYGMGFFSFVTIITIVFITIERFVLVKSPLTALTVPKKIIFGIKKII